MQPKAKEKKEKHNAINKKNQLSLTPFRRSWGEASRPFPKKIRVDFENHIFQIRILFRAGTLIVCVILVDGCYFRSVPNENNVSTALATSIPHQPMERSFSWCLMM